MENKKSIGDTLVEANGVRIVWPYVGLMPSSKVMTMVSDAIANEEIHADDFDGTLFSAVDLLADAGKITPTRDWWR